MLSYFPARDVEEPVTKEFLRAEMADLRTELRSEMAGLRTEFHVELHALSRRLMIAWFGSMTTFAGVLIAAGALS